MYSISRSNPFEVLLAIAFVIVAVGVFAGTFYVFFAYIFSNIKERWREYSSKKKFSVVRNLVIWFAVVAALIALSATRLH